jgi:uncharacterized repeat protein (TIGR03803 family)
MTTITGLVADQATTDQDVIKPFLGVTITGSGSFTVQVKLSSPQFLSALKIGTLSNLGAPGTFTYNRAAGLYTTTGTADQITAALDGLVFTPVAGQVAPGQTVTATFTMSAPADPTFSATSSLVVTDIGFSTLLNSGASALATDGAGNLFGQTSGGGLFELTNAGGVYASTAKSLPTAGGAVTGFVVDLAGDMWLSTSELVEIAPSPSGYQTGYQFTPHSGDNQTYAPRIAGLSWGGMFVVDETHSDDLRFIGFDTNHFSPGDIAVDTHGEGWDLGVTGVVGQVVADQQQFNAFGTTGAVNGSLGSVFEVGITPGAQSTTLATFTGANGADPRSGLTIDAAGNLFGTTFSGGAYGLGTVFEYNIDTHQLVTLASFNGADGANPVGGLLIDGHGDLWGTTSAGGADNDGTVFEIATTGLLTIPAQALGWPPGGPTWNYATTPTTIVTFTGSNGAAPLAGLTFNGQGDLLGSTSAGGSSNTGTVFEITNAGFVPPPALTIYLQPGSPVSADLTTNPFSAALVAHNASFYGIGYQFATVHFTVDGSALTTTSMSGPNGYWELGSIPGLANGFHTVVASETDPLGYGNPISASLTFTLDTGPSVTDTTTAGETVAHGTTVAVGTATPGSPSDTLSLTQLRGPAGALSLENGTVSFTAPGNASGDVTFSYQISDQFGAVSAVVSDTLSVDPGPSVTDTTTAGETVAHGTTVAVGTASPGLAGDTLSLTQLSGPNGALTLGADGTVSFAAPASGDVTFSYQVADQLGDVSAVVSDTLAVDPGPSVSDTTTAGEKVAHDTTVAIGTVAAGLPGDTLSLTQLSGPAGALTLNNGTVSFAAPATGDVAFSYQISDQLGDVSAVVSDTLAVDPGPSVSDLTTAGQKSPMVRPSRSAPWRPDCRVTRSA